VGHHGAIDDEADVAVDWLLTLRQLQKDGMPFEDALAEANRQFDDGVTAKVATQRDPIRSFAMQFVAHDSGDGETVYHCPFCGGGKVTGRSDGTIECGFCNAAFTVQVQPMHPGAPQTINGQPVQWPGQPEGEFSPVPGDIDPTNPDPTAPPVDAVPGAAPPGLPPAEDDKPKGPVPPQFARGSFITQLGHVLPAEAYQRHLALLVADDSEAVLAEVRAEKNG
jgi:hypothetical protein